MPSIFISGIPKGLDRERTARLIRNDIETVAQVRTIWIQNEKGYGFVSLQDETSADFVLSLNEKICINGNTLRIARWKIKAAHMHKTPRETAVPTCKLQVTNDAYVLRGYDTYTNYKRHRPQSEALYQYIQQTPKQKRRKRKPWKDVNHLSQVPSPKSRKMVRAKRQKRKKKISHQKKIKQSASSPNEGFNFASKRHKRSKLVSASDVGPLSKVSSFISGKASTLKGNLESNIEKENINQNLVNSIHTRPSATVHVYDHSVRLCSIEVDNNNVFRSIQAGLKSNHLPSDDTILISYNGKTVTNQWQPSMADDDNIHIVVKGKGGMMQDDPTDNNDNGKDNIETTNNECREETTKYANATERYAEECSHKAVGDRQNTPSTLQQVQKSSPFLSTFSQLSEDYQANLMGELHLSSYFPDKLTYTSVMCISSCEKDEAETLADIPRLMLRKLIMLDFTSREHDLNTCLINMKRSSDELSVQYQQRNSSTNDDYLSMFDIEEDFQEKSSSNEDRHNPVDVFLTIFICLHPILKQKICLKMFACHLAIPIVFPVRKEKLQDKVLMFSMWSLRSITVHDGQTDTSLVNCKQNIVSFVRLGRPLISKAKLANAILYDTAHNAFFNYDCLLGSSEKKASAGLVEAAWFLPSQKHPKDLKKVTLFLNLRGDVLKNAEQTEYLKSLSCVMIIVTDKETMRNQKQMDYFKRPHLNVMFLVTGKVSKDFIKRYKEHYINSSPEGFKAEFIQGSEHGKNIGMSEIKEAVVNVIGPWLNGSSSSKTVQEMCMQARAIGITVDEDMLIYKNGKIAANTIFDIIKDCPLADIKVKYTPLQTESWQNYTDAMKAYRKPCSDFQEKERLEQKMNFQRKKQWEIYKKGQLFMRDFIDKFVTLKGDSLGAFLDSLKFQFDEKSRKEMPIYRKRYAAAWNNFKNKSEAAKAEAEHEVNISEENLSKASFGIEHIFREIGQIYEASLMEKQNELGSWLAKAAARSIQLGYSFELMDGDVANVPLEWVEQVFKELKEMLGDKKLLTLSILGLQSSGKSTLLNAMFGLTFSVSAGRCTRGIYVQLFPVQNNQFMFDYVLIVDTEGLRAPELGDQKCQHDNELATLVLGMADITIVNIKGENTSEVKDILQISVHAFLRLKMAKRDLKLRQSCIFIHQNVSDVGAKDSMIHARKKLDETLDKMTLEAAEEENIGDIHSFKDVIDFDSNHHVWYYSDLWKGDPPMAPANPGYSRDVIEVKSFIFKTLIEKKKSYLTISDTFIHLRDLWNGILANDFVFSFRNSLEIRAYNALEIVYQDLIWKLEQYIKELSSSAEIELKQFTSECETDIDKSRKIPQYTNQLHNEYQKKLQEKQSELKEHLRNYFENGDKKEEIAKWKHGKLFAWDRFAGDCLDMLKKQLADIETHCRVDYKMNTSLEKSKNEIYDQAAALAEHMKGKKPSSREMDVTFNEMWDKWIREINVQEEDSFDIKVLLESILFEAFKQHRDIVQAELSKYPLDLHPSFTTLENSLNSFAFDDNYISVKLTLKDKVKNILQLSSQNEAFKKALEFTNMIMKEIDVKFGDLAKTEWKFDATEMKTIPKRIVEHIDRHNHDKSNAHTFPEPYKVKLCVHVFRFALPLLRKLDSAYRDKYSIKTKLNNHKARVWSHFQDIVDEKSATLIACDRFCEIIRDNVEEKIKSSLPDLINTDIVEEFSCSKSNLMKRIMIDLVRKNSFDKLVAYIINPNTFAFKWLSEYIDSKCFGRSGTIYMDNVSGQLRNIIDVIKKSVQESSASNLHELMLKVQQEIRTSVWIQKESFSVVENQKKTDLDDFKSKVKSKLEQVRSELENRFEGVTETTIRWHNIQTPLQKSMEKLWGCQAICPFCSEPCQWNDKHTSKHACIQHRQGGVAGVCWNSTKILVLESCSFHVQSDYSFHCSKRCQGKCKNQGKSDDWHPFIDYNDYFPDWAIHPSGEISSSKYWAWVLCTFHEEIADRFHRNKNNIPQSWKEITKEDAIRSLDRFTNP